MDNVDTIMIDWVLDGLTWLDIEVSDAQATDVEDADIGCMLQVRCHNDLALASTDIDVLSHIALALLVTA